MKKSMMIVTAVLGVMLALGGVAFGADASSQTQGSSQSMEQGGAMGSSGQAMTQGLEKLSVNIASVEDLQRVPGLDEATARNIVDYRKANGPFASIDDLTKVQGIDSKEKLDPLRKHLSAKLDLNVASSDQLGKVPGVDQSLAQNIIQYREANGPFSSIDDLGRVQGIDTFKMDMIKKFVAAGGGQ